MPRPKERVLAFIWYLERDWEKLLEVSADSDQLEEDYQEWVAAARRAFMEYRQMGFEPHRVYLDVDEYLRWCEQRQRPVGAKSREIFKEMKRQAFYRSLDESD